MTTIVWLTGTRIYHTDPECCAVTNAESSRSVVLGVLGDGYRECEHCEGEYHDEYSQHVCMTCYYGLNDRGECEFCTRFDAIHDHPRKEPVQQTGRLDAGVAGWGGVVVADGGEPT